eukprot:5875681-Alexandrium_andersonii.AAC.1
MPGGRTAGPRWSRGLRFRRGRKETFGVASCRYHGSSCELPAMALSRSLPWGDDARSGLGTGSRWSIHRR